MTLDDTYIRLDERDHNLTEKQNYSSVCKTDAKRQKTTAGRCFGGNINRDGPGCRLILTISYIGWRRCANLLPLSNVHKEQRNIGKGSKHMA